MAIDIQGHILIGMAYKKDVDDTRESPSLRLMELLLRDGAEVDYHDPYIPALYKTRQYDFEGTSVPITKDTLAKYDVVLIATAHSGIDYQLIGDCAKLVVDTRNAMVTVNNPKATVVKA